MKYTKMLPYKLKKALPAIGMMGTSRRHTYSQRYNHKICKRPNY